MSTSYHPQSNGQTEVINHVLEQYLRALCIASQHSRENSSIGPNGVTTLPYILPLVSLPSKSCTVDHHLQFSVIFLKYPSWLQLILICRLVRRFWLSLVIIWNKPSFKWRLKLTIIVRMLNFRWEIWCMSSFSHIVKFRLVVDCIISFPKILWSFQNSWAYWLGCILIGLTWDFQNTSHFPCFSAQASSWIVNSKFFAIAY